MANYRPTELTKSGLSVLQNVIQGNVKLEFSKIKIGIGQVVGDISDLTDLVESKIEANITAIKNNDDGSCSVCGSYTNEGMTESYTLNEIGIFVKDSDGNDVLYAYSTADGEGDWFGAGSTLLQENIEVLVYVSTATNITANIVRATMARDIDVNGIGLDSVLVSMGEVSEGLGGRLKVLENKVSQFSNPNLLINSNLKVSELVNQRGETSYSYNQGNYNNSFDMWQSWASSIYGNSVNLQNEYVRLITGTGSYTLIRQLIEQKLSGVVTASVKFKGTKDETVTLRVGDASEKSFSKLITCTGEWQTLSVTGDVTDFVGNVYVRVWFQYVNGGYCDIEYVKLELGEIATPFVDDDRGTKLNKCYRYLQEILVSQSPIVADSNNQIFIAINLNSRMRLNVVSGTIISPVMCIHRLSNNTVQTIGVKGDVIDRVYTYNHAIELINYNGVQLTKGELYIVNASTSVGNTASGAIVMILSAEL